MGPRPGTRSGRSCRPHRPQPHHLLRVHGHFSGEGRQRTAVSIPSLHLSLVFPCSGVCYCVIQNSHPEMQQSASRRARTPRAAVMLTGSLTCRPGEDSAARRTCAPQALVPVRVAEGPGEATPLPPKKKKKNPRLTGVPISKLHAPEHRVCPGHGFDPARGPGRLSPCTPRERGRSGTGSVGRPVCVGGRGTAIVSCASLSSARPAAISPWPEASPRACAAPWGARRAQGVTRW